MRQRADRIDDLLRDDGAKTLALSAEKPAGIAETTIDQKGHKTSTFADDVRRALRELGRTVKSREVAAWLESHGGSAHTTRELRGACAVELFRQSAKGLGVKKVSRGRYRVDEAA